MAKCKVISGLNSKTPEHLLLDSGAFFKNFIIGTDTYESATAKLIGATKGGGSFSAVPSFRDIEIDGLRGATKGMKLLESWEVKLSAAIVEITPDIIKDSLAIAEKKSSTTLSTHEEIKGKMCIEDSDYIENITWIGNLSGSNDPVIIQVFNAVNAKGLELSFEDKGETVSEMEFMGHFSLANQNEVPFKIFYPKQIG